MQFYNSAGEQPLASCVFDEEWTMLVIHSTTRTELTVEEKMTISRFYSLVNNRGVRQMLDDAGKGHLDYVLRDLTYPGSDPTQEAVSLWTCVERARGTRFFPDDFLPTDEALQVCLNIFYDEVRKTVDKSIQD